MKGATECARRLQQLIRSLRSKLGKPGRPPAGDAVTQLILGIFSRDLPESKARELLDRLRGMVVDYNELRVIPPAELMEMVGDIPDARRKCEDISRALNSIFAREHDVSLERLREMPKKDVAAYLENIDGLDPYVRARIRLYGLGQHAIPLDEAMWAYARKAGIVNARCPLEEAQAFLERRIPEDKALEVVGLLEKQAWAEMGAAVRKGEVEKITSAPPDRTTRHMLRAVASGKAVGPPEAESRTQTEDKPAETPSGGASLVGIAATPETELVTLTEPPPTTPPPPPVPTSARPARPVKKAARRATRAGADGKGAKAKPAAKAKAARSSKKKTPAAAKSETGKTTKRKTAGAKAQTAATKKTTRKRAKSA